MTPSHRGFYARYANQEDAFNPNLPRYRFSTHYVKERDGILGYWVNNNEWRAIADDNGYWRFISDR